MFFSIIAPVNIITVTYKHHCMKEKSKPVVLAHRAGLKQPMRADTNTKITRQEIVVEFHQSIIVSTL